MNVVLLTAGGTGTRMQNSVPKQFINVDDKPLIIYTMEKFEKHPSIDYICVVCLEGWHEILKAYAKQFNITKLKWVVTGGVNGQDSIHNGLKVLEQECDADDLIMIHDGNRAMVSQDIISDSIRICKKNGSAVAAIPCTEAIFRCEDEDNTFSVDSIPRESVVRTQTPHTYPLKKLLWAHQQAELKGIENTAASCVLMQQLNEVVYFSAGSEKNLKITTNDDMQIFKALLRVGE
ncbi:IspD/TarI family cytidylyltransferase [Candidatus Galacturonibacter soehngenii]|uniref:2-C-methyl-D-erythritol 4-phosphate cytidylyltransferase n=1 Tax=Candidatus Galacturonatibacter soehngenii TaxID=2307010 RepID=A0A7V7QKX3_9FIRM|nr:IspD/TarI family cytidylyltransferase [Candidatus Galacturonibacter soehngenii]KAB1438253.1 2-C-methyl-D-erythritol 4-phosphate cytidylyltransferase [Candidatus Galacturonibacter soehngenii]